MNDEAAVGVLHGVAHLAEQPHPCFDREVPRVAVRRHRLALDELHREIRPAVRVEPAVEQPRDGWVIELGENLAFATEARCRVVAVEATPYELQRDDLDEPAIGAL